MFVASIVAAVSLAAVASRPRRRQLRTQPNNETGHRRKRARAVLVHLCRFILWSGAACLLLCPAWVSTYSDGRQRVQQSRGHLPLWNPPEGIGAMDICHTYRIDWPTSLWPLLPIGYGLWLCRRRINSRRSTDDYPADSAVSSSS
jgi:hypothetical protein